MDYGWKFTNTGRRNPRKHVPMVAQIHRRNVVIVKPSRPSRLPPTSGPHHAMMFRGHRPIFGCINHRSPPTQVPFARTAPERTAWTLKEVPSMKFRNGKPE